MSNSNQVTHLFQVQLTGTNLSNDQAKQLASAIRKLTTDQLVKMDFRMEELKPLFQTGAAAAGSCGGGCMSGLANPVRKASLDKPAARDE